MNRHSVKNMTINLDPHQHTLERTVSCCGIGLHSGKPVNLTIRPAEEHSGISFRRSDLGKKNAIPARMEQIVDTTLATTLGSGSERISTTEHLMAALHSAGIDNAEIELDGLEVPIMDGSADPFVQLLSSGGKKKQRALRKVIRIIKPVSCISGDKFIRIEPHNGFKITGSISFGTELINEQSYTIDLSQERFAREIAGARTFGFVEQVEELWRNGLALGCTLENVIAIHWNRRSVLNEEGLRFEDEFVRHKVLDLIGDLALLGSPILGHVIASRSGHALHHSLMKAIADSPDCWEYVEFRKPGQPHVIAPAKPRKKRLSVSLPGMLFPAAAPAPCPA
ncbi:MAG: UDP-3-O-[3-hydroxymyristoyl] N-acetylglucosamine deacetylase [Candidatus Electronema aureum]|uniref:UDP-3-O-acyl-N-acetylglucosamine deacetylase n=1 Tax=Candidatus Electronema aureum TaxID=2005002 RepID=A0A521FZY7_9BACT|nr:MAG: UDP-3-O-[3-hydroxymyristoyl] N-acetylglucosamine deacetylase [Candidatus Electronema aureum]